MSHQAHTIATFRAWARASATVTVTTIDGTPERGTECAGAHSGHFDPLAESAQAAAQTHIVEGPEGEQNEGPELPLEPSKHRA